MKKVLLQIFALLISMAAFSFLSSFMPSPLKAVPTVKVSKKDQPEYVHIMLHRAGRVFEAHGAINTSGTWRMEVKTTGDAFHCINTFTAAEGTLVAISHCNSRTMNGVWQVTSGTGAFAGLEGNGKLMMSAMGEEWEGAIRK